MGNSDTSSNKTVTVDVKSTLIHPDFFMHLIMDQRATANDPTMLLVENDIAMLKLEEHIEFTNYVKGINLPINYTDELLLDTNKTKLMVPGWGKEMHLGKSLPLNIIHSQLLVRPLWQYRLWSFKSGDTNLERFLPKKGNY